MEQLRERGHIPANQPNINVDAIIHYKHGKTELCHAEDKPEGTANKSLVNDTTKLRRLRESVLQLWKERLPDQGLVKHLEALSVQCIGTEIRISGSRCFDNVQLHYEKTRVHVPATFGYCADVSKLLLTMISLKVAALILSLIVSNNRAESHRP